MAEIDTELVKFILENQFLESSDLKLAANFAKDMGVSMYDAILAKDLISEKNLGQLMADYFKLPFVELSSLSIKKEILGIIPAYTAAKYQIIAFEKSLKALKLATFNPENEDLFELISQKVGLAVKVHFATKKDIQETLSLYKNDLQNSFDDLLRVQLGEADGANEAPIEKIIDLLIEYAYSDKASDIHIEPMDENSLIRFRIDGVLHDVLNAPKQLHEQLVTRIKVLSRLRTDEHLSAQDGKMQAKLSGENLDIRVSIVPIVEGEKVVLRLLSSHSRQFTLTDLGMSLKDMEKVKAGFTKPFGMVLSTGPTGSGKTTTIYAILKILNTREKNIAAIEDPVEYEIEGINQIQVNAKTNLNFADGLKAILRQDPNIIFVGEIRDNETADIATNAALTGHLVLSTLHTNDAVTALPRLIDMEIEPFLVASTVNVIIAQRLVRKICEKCRVSYTSTALELSKLISKETVTKIFGAKPEVRLYKGKGCPVCHTTGYQGRVGVFEVLELSDEIKGLITQKADAEVLAKKAIEQGMSTMLEDGLTKASQGITTIDEVLAATSE